MISRSNKKRALLLSLASVLGLSSHSLGAEYWLRAETLTKTMPDASVVTMWGFAQCTDSTFASCTPATVPGPRLTVPPGDPLLQVNLRNNLTGPLVEPVSVVIPGQTAAMTPVKFTDGSGRQRVRSFTAETPPDNTTTVTYSWNNLRPGTYLYQSGSHPAIQIQMGLYGAVTKDEAVGQAYGPGTTYAAEALLLYSEIDPVLHAHVAAGTYGTPPPAGITSTLDYEPKYFLVNGEPFSAASAPLPGGNAGTNILLRFLNAGLETHVPLLQGLYMSIVAEDGNLLPYPRQQYAMQLAAGKTMDAVITPTSSGVYSLYDRKLSLTNGAGTIGGLLTGIAVGSAAPQGIGVFRSGQWFLDANANGAWEATDRAFVFGLAGDKPVVGDWSGSGTSAVGVQRGNEWFLDINGNGMWDTGIDRGYIFGNVGDLPVAGDWTGSRTAKIGVFRAGAWHLDVNGNGAWDEGIDLSYSFGIAGDVPVTGDWNGSGTTKIGVVRGNTWFLDMNGNGAWDDATDAAYSFGVPSDAFVAGDWNGNGTTKIGVMRGSTWYLDTNGNGTWDDGIDGVVAEFGIPGDTPVSGRW